MLAKVGDSLRLLRPRSLARARLALEELSAQTRDLRRVVGGLSTDNARLRDADADLAATSASLRRELDAMHTLVEAVARRESQLRAVLLADAQSEQWLDELGCVCNAERIGAHLRRAVETATLRCHPFPHTVVEQLFPDDFYAALLRGIPPLELFSDKPSNKQHLNVPFGLAPLYSRRVWNFVVYDVMPALLQPLLLEKFRAPLEQWIAGNWPALAASPLAPPMQLNTADGRIMLRRRGYSIPPHRDPKWGFLTGILYLARAGDDETWGTSLLQVVDDEDARGAAPHWIAPAQCRPAVDVPFRPNTLLVFLNSSGAHSAQIPADAEPADLERYIYQFRIGPSAGAIPVLQAMLPEVQQALWAGKREAGASAARGEAGFGR